MVLRFFALLLVCAATTQAQSVRDSAGVRIVTYSEGAPPPATWRVAAKPTMVLGGGTGSGPTEFARIALVARLSNGRIAVVNGTSSEIRYFHPDGRFLMASGRSGRGPGEFDYVADAIRSGDSVVVSDRSLRSQVIGPDGKLVRSIPRRGSFFPLGGVFPDGRVLVQALDPPGDTSSNRVVATLALSVDGGQGAPPSPFAHMPAYDLVRTPSGFSPLMLGPVLRIATAGSRACAGYAERWELRCFGQDGRLQRITRRMRRSQPLAEGEKERWREAYRQQLRAQGRMSREEVEAAVRHFQFADQQSAFGRFLSGPDGELWVSDFQPTEDMARQVNASPTPLGASTWSVLSSDGRWLADVRLPPRFALLDVGQDYLAGIDRDEDDVERVLILSLIRR